MSTICAAIAWLRDNVLGDQHVHCQPAQNNMLINTTYTAAAIAYIYSVKILNIKIEIAKKRNKGEIIPTCELTHLKFSCMDLYSDSMNITQK